MAVVYKLYQPLWSWQYKFYRSTCLLKQIINTRKTIPLNVIISQNVDMCNKIVNEDISKTEWQSIRETFLQCERVTPAIVDSTIMDVCLHKFHVDNAISYFKFLRENNYPVNVGIIGKYLRLYFLKRKSLTDMDKAEIIETYNVLREKYPYLDSITAEHCIISLCLTDQWEKALELIEMMKLTTSPGIAVHSALASAAFKNKRPDIAWKAMSVIALRNMIPQNIAYESHLTYCELEGAETFSSRIEEMFQFWYEYDIVPQYNVMHMYANTATKYGWSTASITMSKIKRCKHCGHSLSKIMFNKQSFQELAEFFMNRVIIGSDIYHKTNPDELNRFKTFIEKTKPYDIVIDGLNVMYIQKNNKSRSQVFKDVIDYFSTREKKILVLTRKHQKNLPIFNYVQQRATVFLIDNLSADDPYILYATMASGHNAMFVSQDLMRQHKHILKDIRFQQHFLKWQCSHQYFVKKSKTTYYIQEPFVYMPTVQKNNNCWHIPCVSDDCTSTETREFPTLWYCLKQLE